MKSGTKSTRAKSYPPKSTAPEAEASALQVEMQRMSDLDITYHTDDVAIEEPLEIRLGIPSNGDISVRSLSVTMRTPGHDAELAAGFLFTEGILRSRQDITRVAPCGSQKNVVRVDLSLSAGTEVDLRRLERHFYTASSCGVCGKTSIEAVTLHGLPSLAHVDFSVEASTLHGLPVKLRAAQPVFDQTGGLHAAALFSDQGEITLIREDVGRHNAVDKLIGNALLADKLPLHRSGLLLSGRASFELMQKAVAGGISFVMAVGAPSSLAVALAQKFDVTILGFARNRRFNIYHGAGRIRGGLS